MAFAAVGQYSASAEDYRRVLALDPANADAVRGLNDTQARMAASGGVKR